jgi:hypothetical protein
VRASLLIEYGPLDVREYCELKVLGNIDEAMQNHRAGYFAVGLAHLHSMLMKFGGKKSSHGKVDEPRTRSITLSTPRAPAICIRAMIEGMTCPRSARDR